MSTPRGIRNANPGNLRHSPTMWMGQLPPELQHDDAFVAFEEPKYGIRALYKTLRTYQMKHALNTVRGIINRWAPSTENDTGAYISAVAHACGVQPDDKVDIVGDRMLAEKMVAAIIQHENGQQPYSAEEIRTAIDMA